MRRSLGLATIALTVALALGQGFVAAPQAVVAAEQASEVIEGQVTKIDPERNRVTVHDSDGKPYEFEASPETLKDLKVGDHIEAKRRPEKN